MKNILFYFATLVLCACTTDPATAPATTVPTVSVALSVVPSPAEQITRATDESRIVDVNFYLIGKDNTSYRHLYTTNANLHFECKPGNYTLYLAANIHKDMGRLSVSALQASSVNNALTADLPMSAVQEVTITSDGQPSIQLPPVEVKRNVTKVAYNIVVAKSVSDIRLASVRVCSIPKGCRLFTATTPSASAEDYSNGDLCDIPESEAESYSNTIYLFENCQGRVSSITEQWQKSPDNAPKHASYLLIRATRGSKALAYVVYLGENNTDNFDVRRNTSHRLNITIKGDNEIDTRVSSYTLTVWDDIEQYDNFNGYCVQNPQKQLHIDVQGENNTMKLRAEVKVLEGNAAALSLDGVSIGAGCSVLLPNSCGKNVFGLSYAPSLFDAASEKLAYTVTIYDDFGVSQSFKLEHRYANQVNAITSTSGFPNGKGSVTASGVLYSKQVTGTVRYLLALCNKDGCTLTATSDLRYRCDGWYSDPQLTKRLTASATYLYTPTSYQAAVYAKFTQIADILLDSKGTSNCYIVSGLNTWYSLDATTMGNGKTTKNISPRKLSGTTAKVIWETGTIRGGIIKNILYENGRIYIETGATRGNAVVGLFNSAGVCMWSWHIWAVSYDPVTTAQTYTSGAVFMDRNLGALTTDYTELSSRGLYYQWGRKDPFVYPCTWNTYIGTAPVVYTDGFDYTVNHPEGNEISHMTVDWSVKHPTTYMASASYSDWDDRDNIPDWLYLQHPNLWGNTSTATTINAGSSKSIYDPCPQGWRVPNLEKFKGITFKSRTTPYYTTIYYNGARTTNYPLGHFFNGIGFLYNGQSGCIYTCSPYFWTGTKQSVDKYGCGAFTFSSVIQSTNQFRDTANPVRCVKE